MLFPIFLTSAVLLATLPAAVTTTGFSGGGGGPPTLAITEAFSFFITESGSLQGIVFDEWVASDGGSTTATVAPFPQSLSYRINGGSVQSTLVSSLIDNVATTAGNTTANDGYVFLFTGLPVTAGQTITFLPAALTFNAVPGFNPAVPSVFTGNAFAIRSNGTALSGPIPVPEPAVGGLLCGVLGWLGARRKRRLLS